MESYSQCDLQKANERPARLWGGRFTMPPSTKKLMKGHESGLQRTNFMLDFWKRGSHLYILPRSTIFLGSVTSLGPPNFAFLNFLIM